VAAYLGAYLGTRLVEQTGSWESVFYASAVLAMLSGLTALVLRSSPLPKKATSLP
jgi:hypothetical protein